MSFFGRETVEADLELHRDQAGLVVTGTLYKQGGGTVPLDNVSLVLPGQASALGGGGFPVTTGTLTIWRTGEAMDPRPDDTVGVALRTGTVRVQLKSVAKALNDDEADGFARYDCVAVKGF